MLKKVGTSLGLNLELQVRVKVGPIGLEIIGSRFIFLFDPKIDRFYFLKISLELEPKGLQL